jgi:folate-binding Fe-S cluster repair protein YgfZ
MPQIPQNKKEFLQTAEPLTLFCFVDLTTMSAVYKLTHPMYEHETQQAGLAENPEHIYLYIRNQAARDYVGVYGTNLNTPKEVSVTI